MHDMIVFLANNVAFKKVIVKILHKTYRFVMIALNSVSILLANTNKTPIKVAKFKTIFDMKYK